MEITKNSTFELPPWNVVSRYDARLPRYTSYPTTPMWRTMNHESATAALERGESGPVSIYVHIPFCRTLCAYCGCNVIITRVRKRIERYLSALKQELRMVRERVGERALMQLHFGGGTPTFLRPTELAEIANAVFSAFPPATGAELGIEIDPRSTSKEHLSVLAGMGFNRLSMGVQDFSQNVQELIARNQPATTSTGVFRQARQVGFSRINIDLMYGLPGQTIEGVQNSAEQVAMLGADRVALFGYAHVPWLKPQQRRLEIHGIPQGATRWNLFRATRDRLLMSGYVPVGMDHFAKPTDELAMAIQEGTIHRNFQGYTVLPPMPVLGLGVSAISDVGGAFLQNHLRLSDYMSAIENHQFATFKGLVRTADDELRRYVIGEIMCSLRVRASAVLEKFGIDFMESFCSELSALQVLRKQGLVEFRTDEVRVTERGRPLLRNVAAVFDVHLSKVVDGGQRFSQAV